MFFPFVQSLILVHWAFYRQKSGNSCREINFLIQRKFHCIHTICGISEGFTLVQFYRAKKYTTSIYLNGAGDWELLGFWLYSFWKPTVIPKDFLELNKILFMEMTFIFKLCQEEGNHRLKSWVHSSSKTSKINTGTFIADL